MTLSARFVASVAALLTLAGAASAQTRSSFFTPESLDGVFVASSDGLDYEVTLNLAPTLLWNGNLYTINSVFGFWALSNDDNLTPVNANFVDGDGATWAVSNNNGGAGGVAGWDTNPNTGLTPGQSLHYVFSSLGGTVETFGYHIRVNETFPNGFNTAFFTVPTPGAAALLGLGGLTATRRRRR
jgi:hypothetical protein